MAAKKKSKTPANRYLRYDMEVVSGGAYSTYFVDLAKSLSEVNRRMYRQGRDYHVKRITVVSRNTIAARFALGGPTSPDVPTQIDAGKVRVSVLPDTWITRAAWKRGFQAWSKMQKEAQKHASTNLAGTYNDFKVYMNLAHRIGSQPLCRDVDGNVVLTGDWDYSLYRSPDGTTAADAFEAHMLGDHSPSGGTPGSMDSVGLIRSYGESRATVEGDSPNTDTINLDDPIMNLFDHGTVTDEVLLDLRDDNDAPPYHPSAYLGGAGNHPSPTMVQVTTLGADGRATVGGFNAICGLIRIDVLSDFGDDEFDVLIEVAPGSYRGVAAEVI
jgi:hypothetical protein